MPRPRHLIALRAALLAGATLALATAPSPPATAGASGTQPEGTAPPAAGGRIEPISIPALNRGIRARTLPALQLQVDAFVVRKEPCLCPEGMHCAPCCPKIVISEHRFVMDDLPRPTGYEFFLPVPDVGPFALQAKYRFTLRLPADVGRWNAVSDRKLTGYARVP